jgi:hypothetical protein
MEALMAAAAAQQTQSQLQVRVSTWRQRIDPVLAAEEERNAFDIHTYGSRLLDSLGTAVVTAAGDGAGEAAEEEEAAAAAVPFARLVAAAHDRHEVSRTFAAMLQLVNNRNVALRKRGGDGKDGGGDENSGGGGGSPDRPFDVELLSADMLHLRMGEGLGGNGGGEEDEGLPLPPARSRGGKAGVEAAAVGGVENRPVADKAARKPAAKKARRGKAAAA